MPIANLTFEPLRGQYAADHYFHYYYRYGEDEHGEPAAEGHRNDDLLELSSSLLSKSGGALLLQSNAEAAKVLASHGAQACTDVTGFGLLGHLYELCSASQVRCKVRMGAVPLLPGAKECVEGGIFSSLQPANLRLKRGVSNEKAALSHPAYPLLFDPQTSGGLLAAVPKAKADACVAALRKAGYEATSIVGEVAERVPKEMCVRALIECVE